MSEGVKFIDKVLRGGFENLNCVKLGVIESIDTDSTINCKILNKAIINNVPMEFPLLVNVPLLQFGTQNMIVKLPFAVGDRVLILIADSDIQNILISGSDGEVNTTDIHALNDAVALPMAFNTIGSAIGQLSEKTAYIGFKDSSCYIKIEEDKDISIVTSGQFHVTSSNYNL